MGSQHIAQNVPAFMADGDRFTRHGTAWADGRTRLLRTRLVAVTTALSLLCSCVDEQPKDAKADKAADAVSADADGMISQSDSDVSADDSGAKASDGLVADGLNAQPDAAVDAAVCLDCAPNETCQNKICTTVPLPNAATLLAHANKIKSLALVDDKQGCDLDGDGKVDNSFGKVVGVYPAANTALSDAVKEQSFVALLSAQDYRTDGVGFAVSWLFGEVKSKTGNCTGSSPEGCTYLASKAGLELDAKGQWRVKQLTQPITVSGGVLKGADLGPTKMGLPMLGQALELKLLRMQWAATAHGTKKWEGTTKGILCGVIDKDSLAAWAKAAAESGAADDTGYVAGAITTDQVDGASFAVAIETKAVTVVGWGD
ncbi:MAG: hypothetical protein KC502_02505 [Myxococcales bacterium]|nr:hypothetical protein [Myxococcales bacterium]